MRLIFFCPKTLKDRSSQHKSTVSVGGRARARAALSGTVIACISRSSPSPPLSCTEIKANGQNEEKRWEGGREGIRSSYHSSPSRLSPTARPRDRPSVDNRSPRENEKPENHIFMKERKGDFFHGAISSKSRGRRGWTKGEER